MTRRRWLWLGMLGLLGLLMSSHVQAAKIIIDIPDATLDEHLAQIPDWSEWFGLTSDEDKLRAFANTALTMMYLKGLAKCHNLDTCGATLEIRR